MQYILILASIFLAFATSCKKSSGGSSAPAAKPTLTAPACSASLALFTVPNPQDNISANDLNKLGMTMTVQAVVENGVNNPFLTIIPTADSQGRTAEFPRISICNQSGKCMPEFNFPYWTGVVALPANMTGTLTFKAKACTHTRKLDPASGLMFNTGRQCATNPIVSATFNRPTPDAKSATNLVSKYQVREAIQGLGTYLEPFAQSYISFVGNKKPTDPSEQVLYKIANTITNDPDQVGAYLAGPLYKQFFSYSGSNRMGLADSTTNPCVSTPPTPAPVVTPMPVLANDPNGNLLGATTVTQTVTETTTALQYVTVTNVVTDTITDTVTNTILPSAFSGGQPLTGYKLRVLDAASNIQGCMYQTGNINIGFTKCADTDKFRWNLIPVNTMAAAFQIQTFKNPNGATSLLCLTQSQGTAQANVSLILTPCDATNNQQIFRFSNSALAVVPQTGNGPSSNPYTLLGYTGSTSSANCVDLGTKGFTLDATGVWTPSATPQACTTSYSIDPINEHLSNLEQYLAVLGINSKDPNKAAISTYLVFGGATLAIIGAGMWIANVGASDPLDRLKTIMEDLPGRLQDLDKISMKDLNALRQELSVIEEEIKFKVLRGTGAPIADAISAELSKIQTLKNNIEILQRVKNGQTVFPTPNGGEVTITRADAIGFVNTSLDQLKPVIKNKTIIKETTPTLRNGAKYAGIGAAFIGAATAVAGGIWWGAEYSLSSNPRDAFVNALKKADNEFLLLKAVQNQ